MNITLLNILFSVKKFFLQPMLNGEYFIGYKKLKRFYFLMFLVWEKVRNKLFLKWMLVAFCVYEEYKWIFNFTVAMRDFYRFLQTLITVMSRPEVFV